MFTKALFTVAKMWKLFRCSSVGKCIKEMYLYSLKYYSTIRKSKILSFIAKWMNMEDAVLSELGRHRKTYFVYSLTYLKAAEVNCYRYK